TTAHDAARSRTYERSASPRSRKCLRRCYPQAALTLWIQWKGAFQGEQAGRSRRAVIDHPNGNIFWNFDDALARFKDAAPDRQPLGAQAFNDGGGVTANLHQFDFVVAVVLLHEDRIARGHAARSKTGSSSMSCSMSFGTQNAKRSGRFFWIFCQYSFRLP